MTNQTNDLSGYIQYTHPPGIFVADYYLQPSGYKCFRPAGTKDWLIMFTISGKGNLVNGNALKECSASYITIIPPGTPHHYYTAPGHTWEKMWAHFLPRSSWQEWISLPKQHAPIIHRPVNDPLVEQQIHQAFKRLLGYNLNVTLSTRVELAMNALEEMLLLIHHLDSAPHALDSRVKKVLEIITHNYTETHPIETLAQAVCLSPSRLAHLFKEQVGESIKDALLKYRLQQAEKRLIFTDRSVTEIAIETGFNSPDYFSRQFSKYYGQNPVRYRKHAKQKEHN